MANRLAAWIRQAAEVFTPLVILAAPLLASQPVGLITAVTGGAVRRAGTLYAARAKPGDALFPGDRVIAAEGVAFAFCPSRRSWSITKATVDIGAQRVTAIEGHVDAPSDLPFCVLPPVETGTVSNIRFYADDLRESLELRPSPAAPALSEEQQAALRTLEAAAAAAPADVMTALAYAVALSQAGRNAEAVAQYTRIERILPGALWTREVRQPAERRAASLPIRALGGTTYAVVIGISRYPLLPGQDQLQYAAADAADFYKYLTSPAGGVLKENSTLLLGRTATRAAIRSAIAESFAKARENDTIVLYVAAHGIAPDEQAISDAYLLSYDSDPEDLPHTAIRMSEVQALLQGSSRAREVRVFIDACRSGRIGSIVSKGFNRDATRILGQKNASSLVMALLASRAQETSFECENFKHGAFTYYVLRGLSTDEAADSVGRITADSLFHYVSEHVHEATLSKQTPVSNPGLLASLLLRRDRQESVDFGVDSAAGGRCENARGRFSGAGPEQSIPDAEETPLERDLQSGTATKSEVDQAVSDLQALAGRLTATDYDLQKERLRVALENAGQRILLRYLKGEAVPQTREMFELGAALFAAAHRLAPGDNYLLSRELFCEGRVQVFQMNYDGPGGAIDLLEDAIRLDGSASYAYNAIGIALLQQAEYDRAEAAFRDAIRLAPYWIYPRHNLALALEERGDARRAVEVYRAALDLRPQYAYLAYNLGTTLEKLNRSKTAREAFNQALVLDPAMARAYTGIGVSYALEGSRNKAETAYGQALRILERMPLGEDLLTARHDLALLLSAGEPDRALDLWKDNLAQAPAHLPSLIGMAETYERLGRPEAIEIYERITALQNGYVAAHLAAARLLIAAGRFAEALPHLEQARSLAPENAAAWELSGDAAHGSAEARLYYETALRLARDRAQRARILKKRPQTSPR